LSRAGIIWDCIGLLVGTSANASQGDRTENSDFCSVTAGKPIKEGLLVQSRVFLRNQHKIWSKQHNGKFRSVIYFIAIPYITYLHSLGINGTIILSRRNAMYLKLSDLTKAVKKTICLYFIRTES
jgi:hypothetical protein